MQFALGYAVSMPGPPPLSQRSQPVRFIQFEGEHRGLHTAAHDRIRLERAQRQAQEWLNRHPEVQVVAIN